MQSLRLRFLSATRVRCDLLAFGREICGPVMCADSRYGKELASYWVTLEDSQQKFRFDLGELFVIESAQDGTPGSLLIRTALSFTSVNPVEVGCRRGGLRAL